MLLVAREYKRDPSRYTAAAVFMVRPDRSGGIWSINEIEGGFRLNYESGAFNYTQAENQKLRLETELARISNHHKTLVKTVRQREHDLTAMATELRSITAMIAAGEGEDIDINLSMKQEAMLEKQKAGQGALEYWQKELETFEPTVKSLNDQIEQCKETMAERTNKRFEFMNKEPLQVEIAY